MAKFYGLLGEIMAVRMTEQEELDMPVSGHDDETAEIDPEVNEGIFNQYAQDHNNHSIVDGVLYYQGQPVTINPHGQFYIDTDKAKQFYQDVDGEIDWLQTHIDVWDSLSGTEKQAWLVNNFDRVLREIQGVFRFVRWLIKKIGLLLG